MKWITVACYSVAFLIIGGFAGLTMGINLHPESTVRFVPNWGSLGDWVAGIAAVLTFGAACFAMTTWRVQERNRLVLLWKADLVDYAFTLPYLKERLVYSDDKDLVDKIAAKFYCCVKSYMLMIEYATPEKAEFYKLIWSEAFHAHNGYVTGEIERSVTKEAFTKAYLNQFI